MSTVAKRYTPEDLLTMPDGDQYELVNGELVEKNTGFESGRVGGRIHHLLETFLEAHAIGRTAPGESSYQCFADDPTKVRKPDVSFISFERLPADQPDPIGHCRVVPDLAVEVVSPNDLSDEVETKVHEYLDAGVRLVWVVHPRFRTVQIRRPNVPGTVIGPEGELSGEDVLPEFSCKVSALFPSPRPA